MKDKILHFGAFVMCVVLGSAILGGAVQKTFLQELIGYALFLFSGIHFGEFIKSMTRK
tara:strand:- start:625 stop:798 length:174 start_codon:yes stop_codon:yes gene_type:complete